MPTRSTTSRATSLGQQPFEATSVFNFYRPGYAAPAEQIEQGGDPRTLRLPVGADGTSDWFETRRTITTPEDEELTLIALSPPRS